MDGLSQTVPCTCDCKAEASIASMCLNKHTSTCTPPATSKAPTLALYRLTWLYIGPHSVRLRVDRDCLTVPHTCDCKTETSIPHVCAPPILHTRTRVFLFLVCTFYFWYVWSIAAHTRSDHSQSFSEIVSTHNMSTYQEHGPAYRQFQT